MPVRKKITKIETSTQIDWAPKIEEKEQLGDLRSTLESIRGQEGVAGYIIRENSSATVNINDPSKIIDYAVLSGSAYKSAERLAEAFHLGSVSNAVIVGENLKVLLLTIGDQNISMFMEKNADHESICKQLL